MSDSSSSVANEQTNEQFGSSFVQWLEKIQDGIFGLLFIASKDIHASAFVVIMEMLIDLLQVLFFPFQILPFFAWNQGIMSWFQKLCSYLTTEGYIHNLTPAAQIVFYLTAAIIGLLLADAIFVAYSFSSNKITAIWPLRLLRSVTSVLITIFFIPVFALFVLVIAKCSWTGLDAFSGALALVIGLLYLALSFMFTATFYARNPCVRDSMYVSKPHALFDMWYLLVKTVLTGVFIVCSSDEKYKWLLILLTLFGSTSTAIFFTWSLPLYKWWICQVQGAMLWLFSWASICLTLLVLQGNSSDSGTSLLFFVCSPMVIALSVLTMSHRRRHIEQADSMQLSSPIELELKARFMLEEFTEEEQSEVWQYTSRTPEHQQAIQELLSRVDDMYAAAVKKFHGSAHTHLQRAMFYFHFRPESKNFALTVLTHADSKSPAIYERFLVYWYRKYYEESYGADGNKDVIEYLMLERNIREARLYDLRASASHYQFWTELLMPSPNLSRLELIADTINRNSASALKMYAEVMSMNNSAPQLLRSYASFLIDIVGDQHKGEQLLNRADELENAHMHGGTHTAEGRGVGGGSAGSADENNPQVSMFDDRAAVFQVSGQRGNLGTIMSCNVGASRLFGYSRDDLISSNIKKVMPAPYSTHHNKFMQSFIDTDPSKSVALNLNRFVLALHKAGTIMPMMLSVREVAAMSAEQVGQGPLFLGVLRHSASHTRSFMLLVDPHGMVTRCTANCSSLFGSTLDNVWEAPLHVSELLDGYDANCEQINTSQGAVLKICAICSTGTRVDSDDDQEWDMSGSESEFEDESVAETPTSNYLVQQSELAIGGEHWSVVRIDHTSKSADASKVAAVPTSSKPSSKANRSSAKSKPANPALVSAQQGVVQTAVASMESAVRIATSFPTDRGASGAHSSESSSQKSMASSSLTKLASKGGWIARTHLVKQSRSDAETGATLSFDSSSSRESECDSDASESDPDDSILQSVAKSQMNMTEMTGLPVVLESPTNVDVNERAQFATNSANNIVIAPSPQMSTRLITSPQYMRPSSSGSLGSSTPLMTPLKSFRELSAPVGEAASWLKSEAASPTTKLLNKPSSAFSSTSSAASQSPVLKPRGHSMSSQPTPSQIQSREGLVSPVASRPKTSSDDRSSSSSHSDSASLLQAKLRRFTNSQGSHLNGDLLRISLKWALRFSFLLLCALTLTRHLLISQRYADYTSALSNLIDSSLRAFYGLSAAMHTHTLLLVHAGIVQPSEVEYAKAKIFAGAMQVQQATNSLFYSRRAALSSKENYIYNTPRMNMTLMRGGKVVQAQWNLADAIAELVASSLSIYSSPVNSIHYENEHVFFIMHNSDPLLSSELDSLSNFYVDSAVTSVVNLGRWSMALTCVVTVGFALVLLLVVRPVIVQVEANKEVVLRLFIQLPTAQLKEMQRSTRQRLVVLREHCTQEDLQTLDGRMHLEIELAIEEEAFADMEGNFAVDSSYFQSTNSTRHPSRGQAQSSTPDGGEDALTLEISDGADKKSAGKKSRRPDDQRSHSRNGGSSHNQSSADSVFAAASNMRRHLTLLRIMLWAVVVCIYIGLMQYFEHDNIASSLTSSPYFTRWSTFRSIAMRRADFFLRRYAAHNISLGVHDTPPSLSVIYDNLAQFDACENNILYGNSQLNLLPYSDASQDQVTLNNACSRSLSSDEIPDCKEFAHGLLSSRGAHSVVGEYLQLNHRMLSLINDPVVFATVSPSELLNHTDMQLINHLDTTYLRGAFNESSKHFAYHGSDYITNINAARVTCLSVFLVLTALVFFLYYQPLVTRLDTEIRNTRAMLLLIPAHVIEQLPSVQQFITDLMSLH